MTRNEWETCSDPQAMLTWLREQGKLSERKARLFAVACCRRIWPLLTDERSRTAVAVVERLADGRASEDERDRAIRDAAEAFVARGAVADAVVPDLQTALGWFHDRGEATRSYPAYRAAYLSAVEADPVAPTAAQASASAAFAAYAAVATHGAVGEASARQLSCEFAGEGAAFAVAFSADADPHRGDPDEVAAQAAVLRDIINPFYTRSFDPALRTTKVVALASTIYETRDFSKMPDLAALLASHGCTDTDLLAHLTAGGPHAGRGCWGLDAVLGRT